MSRRQLLTIIAVNALISLVIAVAVVLIAFNIGVQQAFGPPTPYVIVPVAPTPRSPATAAPLPSPSPTIATETYIVQPGDTLLGIALQLEVDPQLLLAINNLPNADRLLVGQTLRVPLGSLPTPTVTPTALPVTATPTAPSFPETTSFRETPVLMAIVTPGDLATEAVRVSNLGQQPLSLRNWSLSRADSRRYVFPNVVLAPGRELTIHSKPGADGPNDLYWGQTEPAWLAGATVILSDQSGAVVTTYVIGE